MPERAPLTDEMLALLHRLTGGIPKALTALLVETQQYALSQGYRSLSHAAFLDTAPGIPILLELKSLIDGLVGKDALKLRTYRDVDQARFADEWIPQDDSHVPMSPQAVPGTGPKDGKTIAAENRKRFKADQTRRKKKSAAKSSGGGTTQLAQENLAQLDAYIRGKEKG